jgi:hypothetical protein
MGKSTFMMMIASVGLAYQEGYEWSTNGQIDVDKPLSHNL